MLRPCRHSPAGPAPVGRRRRLGEEDTQDSLGDALSVQLELAPLISRSTVLDERVRHADAVDRYGASAHRVGRRVMAAAHVLHYGVGVPVRKVPAVLRALTGVELSQGAISQDALRRARGAVGDAYHKLRGSVRASPLVHTDDTRWRVDGGPAFLMAFETDEATVYQVRARHRNEEVREVVPSDYGGG